MKYTRELKRRICTIANRLKKMGLTLSAAFKKAWALIKGKTITSRVAGVTKENRQKALHRIATQYDPSDVKVTLVRDTANLYDNHAVMIDISVKGSISYVLGYIPRNLAYVVSILIDRGIELKTAFTGVTGHYEKYMHYGAAIELQLA